MRSLFQIRSTRCPSFFRSRGFTLVELLITVGIIALLIGLSLVGITIARKNSQKARVKSDLGMIAVALEAYHSDFGDYPRFPAPSVDQVSNNDGWLDYTSDRGARLLCQALIAPGPAVGATMPDGQDGCDGPGFRVRVGPNGQPTGKVYGPYLAADKFKLEFNPALPNMQDAKILDIFGNPILYYPALPGPPNIAPPNGLFVYQVDPSVANPSTPGTAKVPFYNAYDNSADTTSGKQLLGVHDMGSLLGDTEFDGSIAPPEIATTLQPYLLWTAGPDGIFGLDAKGKSDDITNFDFEPNPQKYVQQ